MTLEGIIPTHCTHFQLVVVKAADRAARRGLTHLLWMPKFPAVLTLSGSGSVFSYFYLFKADLNEFWEHSAFKSKTCQVQDSFAFSGCSLKVLHARHWKALRLALFEKAGFYFILPVELSLWNQDSRPCRVQAEVSGCCDTIVTYLANLLKFFSIFSSFGIY